MKKILTILLLFTSLIGFGQNINYYVSMTDGDDSRSSAQAQNPATPWKTIGKVDNVSFQADDSIFFKRGDTWKERFYLFADATEGHSIVVTAYGTGAKPIISSKDTIPGWSNDANWSQKPGSANIWRINFGDYGETAYRRIWVGNSEYHVSENLTGITSGKWYYKATVDSLYLYSTSNPGTTVNAIWSSWIQTRTVCMQFDGAHYFTVKNIECEGGISGIDISNSVGIVIDSCKISSWYGVIFHGSDGTYTEDCEVKDCVFDPEGLATTGYTFNPQYSYDAIEIQGGTRNILAHDNYVKNYGHNSVYLISTTDSENDRIDSIHVYDNFITSPDLDYGGRVGTSYVRGVGNKMYRNIIQNTSIANQFAAPNLEFYYNIIDTIKASAYDPGNAMGIVLSSASLTLVPHDNKFYNNTISNVGTGSSAIYISWYTGYSTPYNNEFINNVVINPGNYCLTVLNSNSIYNNTFKNNIFYKTGVTNVISYRGTPMSVATFNTSDAQGDVIEGNIGTDPIFISGTRQPNFSSPAINSGLDLQLTTDNVGNALVGMPDIGALEYQFPALPSTGLGFDPIYYKQNVKDTLNVAKSLRLKGVPVVSTAHEINMLNGMTASTPELNFVDGVTSNIQAQFDALKIPVFTSSITIAGDTTVTAVIGKIVYQAADSSFYGCRSTVANKKWYKLND